MPLTLILRRKTIRSFISRQNLEQIVLVNQVYDGYPCLVREVRTGVKWYSGLCYLRSLISYNRDICAMVY